MADDRMEAVDRYCTLNGLRFHYQQWGDPSAPPLVLLHGVLGSAVVYDAIAARLANTHFVLVLDQRGHGQSDRAPDYSWPRWVEDLNAFWEVLRLGKVDLVGHSMGAHHAARFAGSHPEWVRRLVLIEGGFGPINHPDAGAYWEKMAALSPADGYDRPDAYVDLVETLFPRTDRTIVEAGARRLRQDDAGRWRSPYPADLAVLSTEENGPTDDELRRLRAATECPVLVIHAAHSELFVGDEYRAVAAEYPQGTAALQADSGHNGMWEDVPALVDRIENFIA